MTQPEVSPGGGERLGLLVVGMHRSGTSAATRIISLLGPQLPSNLMPASAEFNAAGFWESLDVVALNEKLLAAAQSSWDDVLPIDPARLGPEIAEFRAEGVRILRAEFGEAHWFVLKDPRIGRLLAPWLDAVRAAGAKPLVVIPVRHPLEVAASLQRREGFSEDKSFYLWVRHQVDVLRSSRGETRAVMIYDELMADWRGAAQRLAQDLGIRWPRGLEEVAAEADGFLDPALRHHQVHSTAPQHSLPGRLACELYDALCKRSPGLDALADSIDQQLAPAEALFASLQRDAVRRVAISKAALEQQRMQLERQQQELGRLDLLTAEVAALHEERARAIAVLADLQATVERERAVHARLAAEFEEKVRHVQVLEQDRADLTMQRDRGISQIGELEATVASERAAFARLQSGHDASEARLKELVAELEGKERHVQALMGQLSELQSRHDASEARVKELVKALEEARIGIAKIDVALS